MPARGRDGGTEKTAAEILSIAVREHTDSRSPVRPQLHSGFRPAIPAMLWYGINTWPNSPAKSHFALHNIAIDDDAAAKAGSDHHRDRCLSAVGAEDGEVSPERTGVAIVQISHGLAEPFG